MKKSKTFPVDSPFLNWKETYPASCQVSALKFWTHESTTSVIISKSPCSSTACAKAAFSPSLNAFTLLMAPSFSALAWNMVFQTIGAPKHGWTPEERGSWMKKIPSDTIYCKNTNPWFQKQKKHRNKLRIEAILAQSWDIFKTSVGWSFSRAFPPYRSIQAPSLVAQSLRMASCAAALPWTVSRSSSCALLRSSRANSRSRAAWTWTGDWWTLLGQSNWEKQKINDIRDR